MHKIKNEIITAVDKYNSNKARKSMNSLSMCLLGNKNPGLHEVLSLQENTVKTNNTINRFEVPVDTIIETRGPGATSLT
jgi:hypothetical protein